MRTSLKTRILLIDDHPIVRAGIAALISDEQDMEVVAQAATAEQGVACFTQFQPDVTVVDLSLPDMSGIELIGKLLGLSKDAYIVVLTVRTGAGDVQSALQAGAHSYLFKGAPFDEILSAIRMTSRGGYFISPAAGCKADALASRPNLTLREMQVLTWILRGHSNQDIGNEMGIAEHTVKSHVKIILSKLGVDSRAKAVAVALKNGFVHVEEL